MLNNSDKKDNCERYRGHSRINLINQYSKFTLARVCHRSFSLLSLSQCVVLCLSMKSTRNVLSDTCTATTLILLVVLPKSARTHTHEHTNTHIHTKLFLQSELTKFAYTLTHEAQEKAKSYTHLDELLLTYSVPELASVSMCAGTAFLNLLE